MQNLFISKNIDKNNAPSCVDGRPFTHGDLRAQMLGGTINIIILKSIILGTIFDESFIINTCSELKKLGYVLGVHRGNHANGDSSDCGFADKLIEIVALAKENTEKLSHFLQDLGMENGLDISPSLRVAVEKFDKYSIENIKVSGNRLITLAEQQGADVVQMQGDHLEKACFVNLVSNTTHDTNVANEQAFNLDLWLIGEIAEKLDLDGDLAKAMSLILYVATEKVLVENKGKDALPIFIVK